MACADLWIGLATLSAYLLVWNFFSAIDWEAWLLPATVGVVGTIAGGIRVRGLPRGARALAAVALVGLGVVWFANQALGRAEDYDFGLYHLNLIDYAEKYPAIPGLANLHVRLGTGDTHLLFVSFLDRGPWTGAGPHLVSGLLAGLLIVELGSRVVLRRSAVTPASFSYRLALLLIPATILLAEIRPTHRISSPNLDFAAFVLFAVGMLYLAEWIESHTPTAALTTTASLALVSTSRMLYWLPTAFALIVVVVATRASSASRPHRLRTAALVGALPLTLLIGWTARQAVLSGYPLFPSTIPRLPVDWRLPLSVLQTQNRVNSAWARWAGEDPNVVLGSWHWLSAWWLPRQRWQFDVVFPLLLLSCLVPSLASAGARDRERARRTVPMLAVLVPSVATLVVWFFLAPDPRFAWGPIWLVPIALAAWALPSTSRMPRKEVLAVAAATAAVGAAALATIGIHDITRLLPFAIAGWGISAAAVLPLRLPQARLLAYTSIVSVLFAAFVILVHAGNIHAVSADDAGPLGTAPLPVPNLLTVQTQSHLVLVQPPSGYDQCWQVLLCVPTFDARLQLRGTSISDGFSIAEHPKSP